MDSGPDPAAGTSGSEHRKVVSRLILRVTGIRVLEHQHPVEQRLVALTDGVQLSQYGVEHSQNGREELRDVGLIAELLVDRILVREQMMRIGLGREAQLR